MSVCPTCGGTGLLPETPEPVDGGRMLNVVVAVRDLTARLGYPPTIAEIAGHVGAKSTSTVQHYVDRLVARGHLLRTPGRARSLRVAERSGD